MPLKGYKQTKEHKKNLSIAFSGKNNPNYIDGRTLKKYYCINCGKEICIGAKRCMSCNKKGKNSSFYIDGRYLEKNYCIDCGKEIYYDAERCSSCEVKKRWQDIKYKEKCIESLIITTNMPKVKEKYKKIAKKRWQDGIYDGVFQSPTNPEKEIMKILEELKLNYIFQFRPENFNMIYDFYISKMNLLIEFDGVYWHSLSKVKERDMEKTEYAKDNGYNLLRFNENNLDDFESSILEKIKKEENYART